MSSLDRPRFLPGDANADLKAMVRVDHAGEYGAVRIYKGQLAGMEQKEGSVRQTISHMIAQEQVHLAYFEDAIAGYSTRPTVLGGLWHATGFALGWMSGIMGTQSMMACTMAIEDEIDQHYQRQQQAVSDPKLGEAIERFRGEELEHRDEAERSGGATMPGFDLFYQAIRRGSRAAIWLSERI